MTTPLRILAVDDEPLALRRLEIILSRMAGATLVGRARSGEEALALIAAVAPDVLLLDIRMAGMDGFDIAEALAGGPAPQIIFVTAFDAFAPRAFDVSAVDYVLKPVEFDRLAAALDKARARMAATDAVERVDELSALLATLRASRPAVDPTPRYESEFWVQHRGEFVRLFAHDIEWIAAERDYVLLHAHGRAYLLRETMAGIGTRLDPDAFLRIHRSAIVQTAQIAGVRALAYGHVQVVLASDEKLRVGRTYVKAVRDLIAGRGRAAARPAAPAAGHAMAAGDAG